MTIVTDLKKSLKIYIQDFLKSSFITYALANVAKFLLLAVTSIFKIFYDIKSIHKEFRKAGLNNYKLGRDFLSKGELKNAKFRFYLANIFRPNSPIILYHLGLIYFQENEIRKSLIIISKILKLRKNFKPAIELFKEIDNKN